MSLRDELRRVFGPAALEWGLFYRNAPALRFELSDEGSYIQMFTRAYDRAREIVAAALPGTGELVIILSRPGGGGFLAHLSAFRALRDCGIRVPRAFESWSETTGPEWEHEPRGFLAFTGGREMLIPLLWGAVAADIGIRPRLRCEVYLADLARGILVHPYDDRGMDVVGPDHALLRDLHGRFDAWLQEHDRARMDGFFADEPPLE